MYIENCPFNKIKILCQVMIGLEKIFRMMYSSTYALILVRQSLSYLNWRLNTLICQFSQ